MSLHEFGGSGGSNATILAQVVPQGKVAAAHLEPEMIRHIHQKAMVGGSEKANLLPYQVFLVFREES